VSLLITRNNTRRDMIKRSKAQSYSFYQLIGNKELCTYVTFYYYYYYDDCWLHKLTLFILLLYTLLLDRVYLVLPDRTIGDSPIDRWVNNHSIMQLNCTCW
jgi:hypothetical protein